LGSWQGFGEVLATMANASGQTAGSMELLGAVSEFGLDKVEGWHYNAHTLARLG